MWNFIIFAIGACMIGVALKMPTSTVSIALLGAGALIVLKGSSAKSGKKSASNPQIMDPHGDAGGTFDRYEDSWCSHCNRNTGHHAFYENHSRVRFYCNKCGG